MLYGMTSNKSKPVPKHVWKRRARCMRAIKAAKAEGSVCHRCDGHGYLDREDWIITEGDGRRVCFACRGSGHGKPKDYPEPLRIRYGVAWSLKPAAEKGDIDAILREEEKHKDGLYWPILEDVFERALNAAEKVAGC